MGQEHRLWQSVRTEEDVIEDILQAEMFLRTAVPDGPWSDDGDGNMTIAIAQINLLGSIAVSLQTLNELIMRGYTRN